MNNLESQLAIDKKKSRSEYDNLINASLKNESPIPKSNSMHSLKRQQSPHIEILTKSKDYKYSPPSPSKKDLNSYISTRKSGLSEEFLELEKLRIEMLEAETLTIKSTDEEEEEEIEIIKF